MTTATEVTIKWTGQSGTEYKYWIYPIDTTFNSSPGNYIFAKETRPGYWAPVYVGQTSDLGERLSNHEKEQCARRNGATHIHVHRNDSEMARRTEERDLILRWRPPCNEQVG